MGGTMLVTKKYVKIFIAKNGMRTGTGVIESLEGVVEEALRKGIQRARANGRTTLMAQDL